MRTGDAAAARRYAAAMFRLAQKRQELDAVAANLGTINTAFQTAPRLLQVLLHPRVTRQRKKELLHEIFGADLRPDVEHFLFLLIDKDRAAIIPHVLEHFSRLVDGLRREMDAEAVSAVPLSDGQTEALRRRLEASTGYTLRLKTRVDESILGGLIVRFGDKLIDGSVATEFEAMREQLKRSRVT